MKDITRRLGAANVDVATELIRRGCFSRRELSELHNTLAKTSTKPGLREVIAAYLHGAPPDPRPTWLAALANGDQALSVHAVVNAHLTDSELAKFERYVRLQPAGHMIRQVQVAIELEQNRRCIGGHRTARNRITKRRG